MWLEERYKNRDSKSIEKAKIFKDVGNKDFQAKNYTSSIQSYTKVALYAPADSEVLPLAIANRSAALYHLGKYEVSKMLKKAETLRISDVDIVWSHVM